MVVHFDSLHQEVEDIGHAEEAEGKLSSQDEDDKLMKSVLESDKTTMEQAQLIEEATNRNIGAFTPDLMFAQLVKNYQITQQILGDKLIRLLTGYDPNYVQRNLKIPEFQKELRENINESIEGLKSKQLVDRQGVVTPKGIELSSLILIKELDNYLTKESVGEKTNKRKSHYGDKTDVRAFRPGDRYKDVHLRQTIRSAIRRMHERIEREDLHVSDRAHKGKISLIFALDASSSMKGAKIDTCKKAGITLAYKAIHEKNEVGLVVFGSEIKNAVAPTYDFGMLLRAMSDIKATKQTDFASMITTSIDLFPPGVHTKHLILLTDALPTVGPEPERDTLDAVARARAAGITISVVGVQLDESGVALAKEIARIGEGRFSLVKNLGDVGAVVLEDYAMER